MRSVIEFGTDVSFYQGKTIDWNMYKDAGYTFTIIKCSIKSSSGKINEADYFDLHYNNSGKAGIKRGVYHFSRAKSIDDAKREAEFVINMMKKRNITPSDIPFGIWYDVEDANCRQLGESALYDFLITFKIDINNAGYGCGLYTNKDWLTNTWDYKKIVSAGIPIWMAQYHSTITFKDPDVIDIWQCTSTGKVPGIVNNIGKYVDVDVNHLYVPVSELFARQKLYNNTDSGKIEWVKKDNKWFCNIDGKQAISQWVYDKDMWYYIGADAVMFQDKWFYENESWYYFNSDGSMMDTGWRFINGYWYYFISGKMHKGWINIDNKWYYLFPKKVNEQPEGSAAIGIHCIDNNYYAFDSSGLLMTNTKVNLKADNNGYVTLI